MYLEDGVGEVVVMRLIFCMCVCGTKVPYVNYGLDITPPFCRSDDI